MVRYPVVPKVALAKDPTLTALQSYVADLTKARGQAKHDVYAHFGILCERIGQLSQAVRLYQEVKATSNVAIDIHRELANVLWEVMVVANEADVDMAEAMRMVEKANLHRVWLHA